jgi:hypothetical protein
VVCFEPHQAGAPATLEPLAAGEPDEAVLELSEELPQALRSSAAAPAAAMRRRAVVGRDMRVTFLVA